MRVPWRRVPPRQPGTDEIETRLKNVVDELERATLDLRMEVRSLRGDDRE